jgi:hypothetical protein
LRLKRLHLLAVVHLVLRRSLEVIGKDCFSVCHLLESIVFDAADHRRGGVRAVAAQAVRRPRGGRDDRRGLRGAAVRARRGGADQREIGEAAFARSGIRVFGI